MNRWHMILPLIICVQPKYSNVSISQNTSLKKHLAAILISLAPIRHHDCSKITSDLSRYWTLV